MRRASEQLPPACHPGPAGHMPAAPEDPTCPAELQRKGGWGEGPGAGVCCPVQRCGGVRQVVVEVGGTLAGCCAGASPSWSPADPALIASSSFLGAETYYRQMFFDGADITWNLRVRNGFILFYFNSHAKTAPHVPGLSWAINGLIFVCFFFAGHPLPRDHQGGTCVGRHHIRPCMLPRHTARLLPTLQTRAGAQPPGAPPLPRQPATPGALGAQQPPRRRARNGHGPAARRDQCGAGAVQAGVGRAERHQREQTKGKSGGIVDPRSKRRFCPAPNSPLCCSCAARPLA